MRLHLVRHPQPLIESGVCYGSSDITVAPQQIAQTLLLLHASLPAHAPIFSSPLRRCADLATQLSQYRNQPLPQLDARLVEMHFGRWEQRPWAKIPRVEVDAWVDDIVLYRPGGGENLAEMAARVNAFYDDLLLLAQNQPGQQDYIVVCHAGTIRLLLQCGLGLSVEQMAQKAARNAHYIGYGEVIVLNVAMGVDESALVEVRTDKYAPA